MKLFKAIDYAKNPMQLSKFCAVWAAFFLVPACGLLALLISRDTFTHQSFLTAMFEPVFYEGRWDILLFGLALCAAFVIGGILLCASMRLLLTPLIEGERKTEALEEQDR